jgi:hypothetical protein
MVGTRSRLPGRPGKILRVPLLAAEALFLCSDDQRAAPSRCGARSGSWLKKLLESSSRGSKAGEPRGAAMPPHRNRADALPVSKSFASRYGGSNKEVLRGKSRNSTLRLPPCARQSVVNERQIEFGEMRRGEFGWRLFAADLPEPTAQKGDDFLLN